MQSACMLPGPSWGFFCYVHFLWEQVITTYLDTNKEGAHKCQMGIAWANIYIMGSIFLILQPVEHVWSPKGDCHIFQFSVVRFMGFGNKGASKALRSFTHG